MARTEHLRELATVRMGTYRIENLIDGIFAIVMTLIVLTITPPSLTSPITEEKLIRSLIANIPEFISYFLAFALLAIFWIDHHRKFHMIKYTNNTFLWMNVFWLMMIALVPFSASLDGDYPYLVSATLFFHLNLFLIAFLASFIWYYAQKERLFDEKADPNIIQYISKKGHFILIIFALAVALCFLSPTWSDLIYLLIPLTKFFIFPRMYQNTV